MHLRKLCHTLTLKKEQRGSAYENGCNEGMKRTGTRTQETVIHSYLVYGHTISHAYTYSCAACVQDCNCGHETDTCSRDYCSAKWHRPIPVHLNNHKWPAVANARPNPLCKLHENESHEAISRSCKRVDAISSLNQPINFGDARTSGKLECAIGICGAFLAINSTDSMLDVKMEEERYTCRSVPSCS